jgi:hypothetical protein
VVYCAVCFEAGVFVLPRGALRYIDGSEVNHLGWLRAHKGDGFCFNDGAPMVTLPYDAFNIYVQLLNEDSTILHSILDAKQHPYIDDIRLEEPWRGTFDLPLTSDDEEFLRLCRLLVFGLLMVMNARPSLISYGGRQGKPSKKSQREFWTPNVIGHGYKAQRKR